jgi:hypothetical protein
MPDSAVLTFTDPDVYYAAVRNAQVEGVVTARGSFRAELTRIDLHRLWMLRGEESLARIHSVAIGQRAAILFATDPNPPEYIDGMELAQGKILKSLCLAWVRSDINGLRPAVNGVPCP